MLEEPRGIGPVQIIPNRGEHAQVACSLAVAESLVHLGLVLYDVDYGPGANVYRPVHAADVEEVRSWMP